jgi:hypothetical protein
MLIFRYSWGQYTCIGLAKHSECPVKLGINDDRELTSLYFLYISADTDIQTDRQEVIYGLVKKCQVKRSLISVVAKP